MWIWWDHTALNGVLYTREEAGLCFILDIFSFGPFTGLGPSHLDAVPKGYLRMFFLFAGSSLGTCACWPFVTVDGDPDVAL